MASKREAVLRFCRDLARPTAGGRPPSWRACAAFAAILVFLTFPGVILLGTSIMPSVVDRNIGPEVRGGGRSPLPVFPGRSVTDGYADIGGSSWQFVPAMHFMAHVLEAEESPWWNPYSACGAFGPETLNDMKFAPVTLVVAAAGGRALAFDLFMILLMTASLYAFLRVVTEHLGLSLLAGIAGAACFLLNGFSLSYVNTVCCQAYFLGPVLLLSLLVLGRRPSVPAFLFAVGTHAAILLATFIPSVVLVFLLAHAFAAVHGLAAASNWKARARLLALQGLSPFVGLALVAFLYLPIYDSFRVTGLLDEYNQRGYWFIPKSHVLSLFSPRHWGESYNTSRSTGALGWVYTHAIFHLGILSVLVAAHGAGHRETRRNPLAWMAVFVMVLSLGRVFGIPPFDQIQHVPGLRPIAPQYYGLSIGFAFALLASLGVDAMTAERAGGWPSLTAGGGILACGIYMLANHGFPAKLAQGSWVVLFFLTLGVGLWVLRRFRRGPREPAVWRVGIVALLLVELLSYVNTYRPVRFDTHDHLPSYVKFLKKKLGQGRILNDGRCSLYPEWGTALQLPQVGSNNHGHLPWFGRWYWRNFGREWAHLTFRSETPGREDDPKIIDAGIDLAAVKYVVVDRINKKGVALFEARSYPKAFEDHRRILFENVDPLPRVFATSALCKEKLTPDTKGLSAARITFTLDEDLLARARAMGIPDEPHRGKAISAFCRLVHYGHTHIRIEAKLPAPSVVVLSDAWHPGWSARVGGKAVHLGRVNEAFRGVVLPAGRHEIVMDYAPRGYDTGRRVSLITLVILGMAGLTAILWRNRGR